MKLTRLYGSTERFHRLLAEHRLASFLITAGLLLTTADAARRTAPEETHVGILTWVLLGLMVLSAMYSLALTRWHGLTRGRLSPARMSLVRLGLAWTAGLTVFIYGFVAVMTGSPLVVLWVGVLLALLLTGWVLMSVGRDSRPTGVGGEGKRSVAIALRRRT